jgi:hypothetical protein
VFGIPRNAVWHHPGIAFALPRIPHRELRALRLVHEASNVILLGPPDVGKTHLAVALAETAIQSGQAAYFMTAHDLLTDLGRAYREGRLDRRPRIYLAPKVLIIDEMGHLPLDELGATILFELVSARYDRAVSWSLRTKATASGARSSAIRSSRPRFAIACCIIQPWSTFEGKATGSKNAVKLDCFPRRKRSTLSRPLARRTIAAIAAIRCEF